MISSSNILKVNSQNFACFDKIKIAETNQNIANKVKDNLKVWIQEAKTMEATLFQNNQKQQNSYPNQPMSINQSKNQQSFPSFPNNPSNGYPQSSQNYQGNQNQTSKKDSPKYTELLH